eukprot:2733150-Rhodomonas_salina.1
MSPSFPPIRPSRAYALWRCSIQAFCRCAQSVAGSEHTEVPDSLQVEMDYVLNAGMGRGSKQELGLVTFHMGARRDRDAS